MRKIYIAIGLVVSSMGLFALTTQNVHADDLPGSSYQLTSIAPRMFTAHPNGSLSVFGCGSAPSSTNSTVNTYDYALYPNLEQSQTITQHLVGPQFLPPNSRTTPDGMITGCPRDRGPAAFSTSRDGSTLYASIYRSTNNQPTAHDIIALNNNQKRWSTTIPTCPGNPTRLRTPVAFVRGSDGDLYGTFSGGGSTCNTLLIGIDSGTGGVKFTKDLGVSSSTTYASDTMAWTFEDSGDTKIVVDIQKKISGTYIEQSELRYFHADGAEDTSKYYQFPAGNGNVTYIGVGGRIYKQPPDSYLCPGGVATPFYFHDPDGTSGTVNFDSADRCSGSSHNFIERTYPLATGGTATVKDGQEIIFHDSLGDEITSLRTTLPGPSGYGVDRYTSGTLVSDDDGNVLVVRNIANNSISQKHVLIQKIDTSGNVSTVYSTQSITSGTPDYRFNSDYWGNLSVADNGLYIGICHGTCSKNNPSYIHKVELTNFGGEFKFDGSSSTDELQDKDQDGLSLTQEASQNTSDNKDDTDGDGLSDYIESQWYPARNDVFCGSQCAYPNPVAKDIYVEVDWMKDNSARILRPSENQLDEVRGAYAQQGITAHFDTGQYGGGNELSTYAEDLYFEPNASEADFFDYKNGTSTQSANFNADRNGIWRYLVSGHHYMETPSSSGVSYAGSDAIFISTGLITDQQSNFGYSDIDTAIAGTIIHELGHSVCLSNPSSGNPAYPTQSPNCLYGNIDTWSAPNTYSSSMNYNKQMFMVDYSKGLNGSPSDHDDWGAIGVSLADFTKPGRRIENTNEGANYEAEKLTRVRGITIEEARKAKYAGLLGISASSRSSRDASTVGANFVASTPHKKGSIGGHSASGHHGQNKIIVLILVAVGGVLLILSILYVRRRAKFF